MRIEECRTENFKHPKAARNLTINGWLSDIVWPFRLTFHTTFHFQFIPITLHLIWFIYLLGFEVFEGFYFFGSKFRIQILTTHGIIIRLANDNNDKWWKRAERVKHTSQYSISYRPAKWDSGDLTGVKLVLSRLAVPLLTFLPYHPD